jgi:hypothetical protein
LTMGAKMSRCPVIERVKRGNSGRVGGFLEKVIERA